MPIPPELDEAIRKVLEENQKWKHSDFLRLLVPDVVGRLKRLYASTEARQKAEAEEVERFVQSYVPNPVAEQHGYDPVSDEYELSAQIERMMFGNVAVAIDAEKERFIIFLCKQLGLNYQNKKGEANFRVALASIANVVKDDILAFPGAAGHERARVLANCFKHNGGDANAEAEKIGVAKEGQAIAFEDEDWAKMIDDTGTVLDEIVRRL